MGEAMKPELTPAPHPIVDRLAKLANRRDAVVAERAAHKTRRRQTSDAWLLKQNKRMLAFYNEEISKPETLMQELLQQHEALQTKAARLDEAAGIGSLGALNLCVHMPELGKLNKREVAALAGLASFNRDSGQYRGQRHIHGGRGAVRKLLCMPSAKTTSSKPSTSAFATSAKVAKSLSPLFPAN